MAEIALAALSSLAGAGGTAATAAAIATPAAAGWVGGTAAAAGGLNIASILSGVATAASVLGTVNAGFESARQSEDLANEAELDAGQQQLQSTQRSNDLRRELFKVLGENRVAIAAAGVDVGGGIGDTTATDAKRQASRELSIERNDDELRRAMLRARASGLRRAAGSAVGGALLKSFGQTVDYGISLANRG